MNQRVHELVVIHNNIANNMAYVTTPLFHHNHREVPCLLYIGIDTQKVGRMQKN